MNSPGMKSDLQLFPRLLVASLLHTGKVMWVFQGHFTLSIFCLKQKNEIRKKKHFKLGFRREIRTAGLTTDEAPVLEQCYRHKPFQGEISVGAGGETRDHLPCADRHSHALQFQSTQLGSILKHWSQCMLNGHEGIDIHVPQNTENTSTEPIPGNSN